MATRPEQDRVFAESEGNAWFQRNAAALNQGDKDDQVLAMLAQAGSSRLSALASVCDIGCADGSRLARLKTNLPHVSRFAGFDASAQAIASGTASHPGLELAQGLASEPPVTGPFDLVTISFVLHWVDRSRLAQTVQAIDNLVAENGILVLADFLPDRQCARRYHHRQDVALFTYKQDYTKAFTGLGLYREVGRKVFAHSDGAAGPSEDQDRAVCSMLVKQTHYPQIDE